MRKIVKSMAVSMLLVLTLATSAFANQVSDIRSELIAIGVPTNYVANVVEYLQKTTITDAQYNKVMNYIEEGKSIIGGVDNLRELSKSDKNALQSLAVNAASTVGLKAEFGKNSEGTTTLVVTDSNGGTLIQLSTKEVKDLVENFDAAVIIEIVEDMAEFSNDPDKGKYNPVTGELNQTSVSYGNSMVVGAALVVCAAGIFVFSRRRTFA